MMDNQDNSAFVIAYAAVAASGYVMGLLSGGDDMGINHVFYEKIRILIDCSSMFVIFGTYPLRFCRRPQATFGWPCLFQRCKAW